MSAALQFAALALCMPLACAAATFSGKVVRVADGDTITVLVDREEVKVRLAEIDAPERGQPWSQRAKQALAEKTSRCSVDVSWIDSDRYGRRVGRVRCAGRDINRELAREGHVWVYRQGLRDETLLDDEMHARQMRAGLWALPEAERVPPWEWRDGTRALPVRAVPQSATFTCGTKHFCREMVSCEEARFYVESCSLSRLDGDRDGVPCETLCR